MIIHYQTRLYRLILKGKHMTQKESKQLDKLMEWRKHGKNEMLRKDIL